MLGIPELRGRKEQHPGCPRDLGSPVSPSQAVIPTNYVTHRDALRSVEGACDVRLAVVTASAFILAQASPILRFLAQR